MDDEELIAAAAGGDQEAFAALVHRTRAYVYTVAWKVLLHEEDALDVTQETFVQAARNLDRLDRPGALRGWLAAIAVRQALSVKRRPAARREIPTDPAELTLLVEATPTRGPSGSLGGAVQPVVRDRIERQDRLRLVEDAMHTLSAQQRAVFVLRLSGDMSPGEIARHLDLPEGQVRTQLSRAVDRLRDRLSGALDPQLSPERKSDR